MFFWRLWNFIILLWLLVDICLLVKCVILNKFFKFVLMVMMISGWLRNGLWLVFDESEVYLGIFIL